MVPQSLQVGTVVILRDRQEEVYPSRIEAYGSNTMTAVRPIGVAAADPYEVGTLFDVLWTDVAGLHVVPVGLIGSRSEGRVRLWDLELVAEPWIEQRRDYVRVPVFGRVVIGTEIGAGSADGIDAESGTECAGDGVPGDEPVPESPTVHGRLVDLSAAAMQCSMWAEPDDPLITVGQRVTCDFTAHGTDFSRTGVIYATRHYPETHEVWVVVQFEQTERESKALRRQVFDAQVDMRHTWRRQREAR